MINTRHVMPFGFRGGVARRVGLGTGGCALGLAAAAQPFAGAFGSEGRRRPLRWAHREVAIPRPNARSRARSLHPRQPHQCRVAPDRVDERRHMVDENAARPGSRRPHPALPLDREPRLRLDGVERGVRRHWHYRQCGSWHRRRRTRRRGTSVLQSTEGGTSWGPLAASIQTALQAKSVVSVAGYGSGGNTTSWPRRMKSRTRAVHGSPRLWPLHQRQRRHFQRVNDGSGVLPVGAGRRWSAKARG